MGLKIWVTQAVQLKVTSRWGQADESELKRNIKSKKLFFKPATHWTEQLQYQHSKEICSKLAKVKTGFKHNQKE